MSEIDLLIQELRDTIDNQREEIDRLNNIINDFDEWLLGEQMMFYKSNDGERLIRYGETTNKWLNGGAMELQIESLKNEIDSLKGQIQDWEDRYYDLECEMKEK